MSNLVEMEVTSTNRESRDVSQQVQERLRRADQLEDSLREMAQKLQESEDRNAQLATKNRNLEALETRKEDLEAREKQLGLKEQLLENKEQLLENKEELLKLKEENALQRVADHKEMVGLIFRNSQVKKVAFQPVQTQAPDFPSGGYDQAGNPIMANGGTYNETIAVETHEEEV